MNHYLVLFDIGTYRERVEPALRDFFAGASEAILLRLLEETNRLSSESEPLRQRLLSQGIEPGQSIIRILTGQDLARISFDEDLSMLGAGASRPALEAYVSGPVVYELLAVLCVPNSPVIDPLQNIGEGAFLSHLIEHSAWIENALTGAVFGKGEPLRFPLGIQSEALGRADRERLLAELKALPAPDPRAGNEKRVADFKRRLSGLSGTAGLLAKVFESEAARILPAGRGESVADQISNLKGILEMSLVEPNLTVLFTIQ